MAEHTHVPLHFFCKHILDVFQQAIANADPAAFLYRKHVRTPLFMAESLARVLEGAMHSKQAQKAGRLFKKLEDALGEIEDYDSLAQHFIKNKAIKKEAVIYFEKKRDKAIEKLNSKLIEKEFYQAEFKAILNHAAFNFNDKDVVHKLHNYIKQQLDIAFRFYSEYADGFTDMESQVHELRRKLRWISIYGKSFDGTLVFEKEKTTYTWEKKFISAQAKADPYNILPIRKNLDHYIHVNQKAFYALNAVVYELGKIKDKALFMESLAKALRKTNKLGKKEAQALALQHLKINDTEAGLLKEAHTLLNAFFSTYGIHKELL